MIEIQNRIQIARPPKDVFALLADVKRFPEWQQSVTAVSTPGGPLHAGAEFEQKWRMMGRIRRVSTRVATLRQDELIAFAGDAGFVDYYCGFELTPQGDQTALTVRTELRLHGLWRLLRALIAPEMRRETTSELAALKRLVEGSARPSTVVPR